MRIALIGIPFPEVGDTAVYMDSDEIIETVVTGSRLAGPIDFEAYMKAKKELIESGDLDFFKEDHPFHEIYTQRKFFVTLKCFYKEQWPETIRHYEEASDKCFIWNSKQRYWEFYWIAYDGPSEMFRV